MLVAGSVLALLLMGLALDGFLSIGDEEPEDDLGADGGEEDLSDQSGVHSSALSDLLFSGDAGEEDADDSPHESEALRMAYTSVDVIQSDAEDEREEDSPEFAATDPVEGTADADWVATADTLSDSATEGGDFLEVDGLTGLNSGEEVAYVEAFDTQTDSLILEFDGTDEEAPDITIDLDSEQDAAVVLANGVPVTLVEGATDLTPEHVRVVMSGDAGPLVIPTIQFMEDQLLEDDATDRLEDVPPTSPTADSDGDLIEDLLDPDTDVPDEVEVIPGDVAETATDPVTDVVETLSDGLPTDDVITGLLDSVTNSLTEIGGLSEMLDARGDIDDAFGTGGTDALTGSFNDDMISGTGGQDALFGDEGDDTLAAGAGNDELHGDTGNDHLQGGDGIDFLDGGEGNDTLDGGLGRDLLFGGDGDDLLVGGAADDFLQGGFGADTLNGGSGNDVLDGIFGEDGMDRDSGDVLWGGDGDDTIIVGQGDTAHGNAGADLFSAGSYLETAEVAGSVADFDPDQDRIEVIFDPDINPFPVLEVLDFEDGSGADILLNGEVILSVTGAQGLDPNLIDLRAVA